MVSGSKKDSRIKSKGKQPMALAKDSKQAVLAVVVILVFIGTTIHNFAPQNPFPTSQTTTAPPITTEPGTPTEVPASADPNSGVTNVLGINDPTAEKTTQDANNIYSQTLNLQNNQPKTLVPVSSMPLPGEEVEILPQNGVKKNNFKKISVVVNNTDSANPFLPGSEDIAKLGKGSVIAELPPPLETLPSDQNNAGKVMSTTIGGILYDQYSPSAIIKIEGTDYLVKKGDVINNYRILSISKNQVVVQLGRNIYQAGVGELLSLTSLNQNVIANLDKKFGGNNVSIRVKKKVSTGSHKWLQKTLKKA